MQKYILGAEPSDGCALICPFDDTGKTGEWRKYNAGIVYLAEDADARIAELERDALTQAGLLADWHKRMTDLERALKSCVTVIELQRKAVREFQGAATEAIREANEALTVSG